LNDCEGKVQEDFDFSNSFLRKCRVRAKSSVLHREHLNFCGLIAALRHGEVELIQRGEKYRVRAPE
jgi:hypothetical protein